MRYAITGATGFVGGEVVRQLRNDGHDVRALVRDPDRAAALAGLGVELITGDLADLAALRRLTDGTDGLFHLAGWKLSDLHPELAGPVNVEGTRNALTAARETGVPLVGGPHQRARGELRHPRRCGRRVVPVHRYASAPST